jgi:hypothetical protein
MSVNKLLNQLTGTYLPKENSLISKPHQISRALTLAISDPASARVLDHSSAHTPISVK